MENSHYDYEPTQIAQVSKISEILPKKKKNTQNNSMGLKGSQKPS